MALVKHLASFAHRGAADAALKRRLARAVSTNRRIVRELFGIVWAASHIKPALVMFDAITTRIPSAHQANLSLHHPPSVVSPSRAWLKLHLIVILALSFGCAHQSPQQPSGPITEVILPAHVPGWAKFCIESLYLTVPEHEVIIRRQTEPVCAWTVDDIRQWALKQKSADE